MKLYRVVHRIHLGGTDHVLEVGSLVQFNGTSMKTEDGGDIILTQPSAIVGAIKVGWLVLASSPSSEERYVPKASGVQVHSAKSTGEKRTQVNVMTVHEEEQNVGTRKEIRLAGARKFESRSSESSGEGVVVGRMLTAAKALPVVVGERDKEIVSRIESRTSIPVKKTSALNTQAIAEDALEDMLPETSSSRRPEVGVSTELPVKFGSGSSSIGGQEDGVIIGKVGVRRELPLRAPELLAEDEEEEESLLPEDPGFREKALRRWVGTGKTWNGLPASPKDLAAMARTVLESLDALRKAAPKKLPEVAAVPEETSAKSASGEPQSFWDMSHHWKTRLSALQAHVGDPQILREIYAIENSGGVKKRIESLLEALGEPLR